MNEYEKQVYNYLRGNSHVYLVYRFKDRTSGVRGTAPADFLVVTKNRVFMLEVKSRRGRLPKDDFRPSQLRTALLLKGSAMEYYFLLYDRVNEKHYVLDIDHVMGVIDYPKETIPWRRISSAAKEFNSRVDALRYLIGYRGELE